jgi:hypothetical protein
MNELVKTENAPAIQRATPKDIYLDNVQLDTFSRNVLSRPVPENDTRVNKLAGNSLYIPISFVETKLDEVFFGLWETSNFKSQVVANEIIGSIELKVFHPIGKVWGRFCCYPARRMVKG